MKGNRKTFWTCCLVLCVLLQSILLSGVMVYAASGASIAFSSNTVKIGDSVTVTVSFSGGGTAMGTVEAEVTYDTSVLTFVSGDNANEYASGKISLVGFCSVDGRLAGKTVKYANLTMLFVDDKWKRKGVGRRLFDKICFIKGSPPKSIAIIATRILKR